MTSSLNPGSEYVFPAVFHHDRGNFMVSRFFEFIYCNALSLACPEQQITKGLHITFGHSAPQLALLRNAAYPSH